MRKYFFPACLGLMLAVPAQSQPAAEFDLSDLAFMIGHWQAPSDTDAYEEIWLAPKNGVMAGMFRWPSVKDRYVLELLTVSEETEGVVFRFKHFDPDITSWEKDGALTYTLTEVTNGCAMFIGVNIPEGRPVIMQYCLAGPDTLVFRGAGKDEPLESTRFKLEFKRN